MEHCHKSCNLRVTPISRQRKKHETTPWQCLLLHLRVLVQYFVWQHCETYWRYLAVCQNLVPLVNIKIAGKWMFIPLKMVLIGIDPYPSTPMFRTTSQSLPGPPIFLAK